jgi:hypothetical protein
VGLVAGPGANPASCRWINDVEVVELRWVEGAIDSPTERDDGGASSGALEYRAEDLRVELPAVVSVLKEVHEGDRDGIHPQARSASRRARPRDQLTPRARTRQERRSPTKTRWETISLTATWQRTGARRRSLPTRASKGRRLGNRLWRGDRPASERLVRCGRSSHMGRPLGERPWRSKSTTAAGSAS